MCVCWSPQLMEVTGKNQDECMVALHDCNEDVSRAINFLLESTSDMVNNTVSHLISSKTYLLTYHLLSAILISVSNIVNKCILLGRQNML